MSHAPFNHSSDLKQLQHEGYFVQIKGAFLVMREVPYVNSHRKVRYGNLISSLTMAGDVTQKPETHVIYFDGDFPCQADGKPILQIRNNSVEVDLGHGLKAKHRFSSKPSNGYLNYYEKMTTYANILSGPAAALEPNVTVRPFKAHEGEESCIFNYADTASDRVGIGSLSERLTTEKVAIIGVGGTGSYVLDLIAKTPVDEIRLFDDDEFLQHNAFRAPGAPSISDLREVLKKVDYFKGVYSRMHKGIVAKAVRLGLDNLVLLDGISFAFLCVDSGEAKRVIVEKLESMGISFIDVGMGLELNDGSLGGILRVTVSTPERREFTHQSGIPFIEEDEKNLYASNVQVADLNSLNASLAVIKWKKMRGFYRDLEREHHFTYTTDGNMLLNRELG